MTLQTLSSTALGANCIPFADVAKVHEETKKIYLAAFENLSKQGYDVNEMCQQWAAQKRKKRADSNITLVKKAGLQIANAVAKSGGIYVSNLTQEKIRLETGARDIIFLTHANDVSGKNKFKSLMDQALEILSSKKQDPSIKIAESLVASLHVLNHLRNSSLANHSVGDFLAIGHQIVYNALLEEARLNCSSLFDKLDEKIKLTSNTNPQISEQSANNYLAPTPMPKPYRPIRQGAIAAFKNYPLPSLPRLTSIGVPAGSDPQNINALELPDLINMPEFDALSLYPPDDLLSLFAASAS